MAKLAQAVVVAIRSGYTEDNGPWEGRVLWDGEEVSYVGGIYSTTAYDDMPINATPEQIREAGEWLANNPSDTDKSIFGGLYVIQGSRKIPKGSVCELVDITPRYWSGSFWVDSKALVIYNGEKVSISPNCVKNCVRGVLPEWAK